MVLRITIPFIGQLIPRLFMSLRPKWYHSPVSSFHVYLCHYVRNSTTHQSVHSTFIYVITSATVPLISQLIQRLFMYLHVYVRNSTTNRSVHSTFIYVIASETVPFISQIIPHLFISFMSLIGQFIPRLFMCMAIGYFYFASQVHGCFVCTMILKHDQPIVLSANILKLCHMSSINCLLTSDLRQYKII